MRKHFNLLLLAVLCFCLLCTGCGISANLYYPNNLGGGKMGDGRQVDGDGEQARETRGHQFITTGDIKGGK